MREERKDVLVVGAGPVGLWTALQLANAGVEIKLIDSEDRTAARSYACALHPRTLEMLDRAGLAADLIRQGRKIDTVAFYSESARQAEIKLSGIPSPFPFLLIVPQNVLEEILEASLKKRRVAVQWMHRLDGFSREEESMAVMIEELEGTSLGYIAPHWETTVKRELPMRVQFIVGADGNHSVTRRRLKIDYQHFSGPDAYAAYEFESDEPTGEEVRVVLTADSTNVLWPLPGNKWRWTFEMPHPDQPVRFPEKERRAVRLVDASVDERTRNHVQELARQRAPWFRAKVKDVTWCTKVAFDQRLVASFGRGRCWLAGDAAHQAGPVGVQSMNSGFAEGEMLAGALRKIIYDSGEMDLLEEYNVKQLNVWRRLVGNVPITSTPSASPWVKQNARRLLNCVPGLDAHWDLLAAQVGLSVPDRVPAE